MSDEGLSLFQQRLAEKRAADAAKVSTPKVHLPAPARVPTTKDAPAPNPSGFVFTDDLIPDVGYEKTDADRMLDQAIDNVDILTAYARWCGKMTPKVGANQTESIKVSCPVPGHNDSNPSAWINTDKQTWYCGACNMGGDAHDIAAFRFGYPVPGYKDGSDFKKLRIDMAKDMGFVFERMPGGVDVVIPPEPYVEPEVEVEPPKPEQIVAPSEAPADAPAESAPIEPPKLATVTNIDGSDELEEDETLYPTFPWREVCPPNTFLETYMNCTIVDDVAEEYHFFNALMALGFALGRRARLFDSLPVYGNLFICIIGRSGDGKSKSKYHVDRLMDAALPYDPVDPESRGVLRISSPASAEMLIHSFQKPIYDVANPKKIDYFAPVSGMVDFNELSSLIGRANRMGNVLKPTLMQFYDMEGVISSSSLTSGKKEAHQPFACALTTTQPAALKTLLGRTDDDSGFLNRWLFVAGKPKPRFAIGGAQVDITPAVKPLQKILGWSGTFLDHELVQWSPEAAENFTEYFHSTIQTVKAASESELLIRLDLVMKKIVLLLSANKMERVVSNATIEEMKIFLPYIIACYKIPEAQIGNSLQQEVSDAVMEVVHKRFKKDGQGASLREVARSLARRKYPQDLLVKVCDTLAKLGLIEAVTTSPGAKGRPTVRYKYVA